MIQNFSIIFLSALLFFQSTLQAQPPKLRNFGASCYVNALIQALYATNPLTELIPKVKFNTLPGKQYKALVEAFNSQQQTQIDAALFDFYDGIKNMFAPEAAQAQPSTIKQPTVSPKLQESLSEQEKKLIEEAIKESLQSKQSVGQELNQLATDLARAKNKEFDTFDEETKRVIKNSIIDVLKIFGSQPQQDAHEFLTMLIDSLEQSDARKQIRDLFYYRMQNEDTTPIINVPIYAAERELLNFIIANNQIEISEEQILPYADVQTGLEAYFGTKNKLVKVPPILIMALNRFASGINIETGEAIPLKISHTVEISFRITLNEFTVTRNNHKNYDLFAVVVHLGGTAQLGHYIAYVKNNNQWYHCNDMNISTVTVQTVQNEINNNGYILFYQEAQEGEPSKPQIREDNILITQLKALRNRLRELLNLLSN